MAAEQTPQLNLDVGASKVVKGILGGLDRRLIEPAGTLVRFAGWAMLALIFYLIRFSNIAGNELSKITTWMIVYGVYLLILETIRKFAKKIYDLPGFRGFRVAVNLIMVSILVNLTDTERHLLIFAFTVPIFAAVVYFADKPWVKVFVFAGVFTSLSWAVFDSHSIQIAKPTQLIIYTLLLVALSIGFEVLRKRVYLLPSRLTELARELHKTLDLQQLMAEILANSIEIVQAQRGLIIIVNPRTKKYVSHKLVNFKLMDGKSIEELARKCYVLRKGVAFESNDIVEKFNDKTIYKEFFGARVRSICAEPLFNRAGQVIGVINVAHDDPNIMDRTSKSLLKDFAYLVSSAIENCFEHREVKLRQTKSAEVSEKFVAAEDEDEIIKILIDETTLQISHAEKITLHKYLPDDGSLVPLHAFALDATPRFFSWSGQIPKGTLPDLKIGYGLAGHALESRDTILVHNAESHPWFVKLPTDENIKSLLVAPLFDPEGTDYYGTISVESSNPSQFNLDDESTLTNLGSQASRAISKMRDFQIWREEGGTLRRILEQIRTFNLDDSETILFDQIAKAAASMLGFKVARIRMLSQDGKLKSVAMTGVSKKLKDKLFKTDIPYDELKLFLNKKTKAASSYLIKLGTSDWKKFVDKYFHKPRQTLNSTTGWGSYHALVTPLYDSFGKVMGILTLDVPNTGFEPSKHNLELIGLFSDAASWVIELNRSRRKLANQKERTQAFFDTISQELASCRDISTISEVVVQAGAKLLNTEGCSLYLVRGDAIELTHSNYLANPDYIGRRKPISDQTGSGLTAWVAATGTPVRFNNSEYKSHPAWAGEKEHLSYLSSQRCVSLLVSPIKNGEGKVIGVLSLENKRGLTDLKEFDEDDEKSLASLANEFARAFEVIGLYEDIREFERTGLAEDIHDLMNWHHSGIVNWIEALIPWLDRQDYKKVNDLVKQLRQHALTFVHELKSLHTNFLSKSLEAPTFRKALEETLSAWINQSIPKYEKSQMKIEFDCPEDLEVPIRIRNTIIRFASLAFSNALQHSGIAEDKNIRIMVRVEQTPETLILSVIDNGRGIDHKNNPPGFGMDMMNQLVGKINHWGKEGKVSASKLIHSEVNKGTKVVLALRSVENV